MISSLNSNVRSAQPKLMAGAPTGFLSPQVPPPSDYVVSLGLEIAPGIGISLDQKAILIGQNVGQDKLDIIGHLDDGTYPQRDFKVSRQGDSTTIDGKYGWQDYSLQRQGGKVVVTGDEARRSFDAFEKDGLPQTTGKMPAKTFTTVREGNSIQVNPGWEGGPHYTITQEGATTKVKSDYEDMDFTLTRRDDGSFLVDGKLNPQDFVITPQGQGWLVKGYYATQKYTIQPGA